MCGLAGWNLSAGIRNNPRARYQLETLTEAMALDIAGRGRDSWGWAAPRTEQRRIQVVKGLGSITSDPRSRPPTTITGILHTRQATHGAVTVQNAHPFREGAVVFCHNGIVWNADALGSWPVDSMAFGPRLLKDKHDLSDMRAYGVLTWLDERRPHEAFICKLTGSGDIKVMAVELSGGVRTLLWASTMSRVKDVVEAIRARVITQPQTLETGKVLLARNGELYSTKRVVNVSQYVATTAHDEELWHRTWGGTNMGPLPVGHGKRQVSHISHRRVVNYSNDAGYWDDTKKKFVKWEDIDDSAPEYAKKKLHAMTDAERAAREKEHLEDMEKAPAVITPVPKKEVH